MSHPVNRAHSSGAMTAPGTMHEHWLVRWIVHYLQKEFRLFGRGLALVAHSDSVELHSLRFDHRLFSTHATLLQIDDCLHAHRREARIIFVPWLSASIELVINAAEVLDLNLRRFFAL
jgi:hypothetical protein